MLKNDLAETIHNLPEKTGVYLFKNSKKHPLYIGKALNLKKRVSSYLENRSHLGVRTDHLLGETHMIDFIVVDSELEALLLEANLIKKHQPFYNTQSKDDTSFLYIRITNEDYPHVTPDRLPKNPHLRAQKEKEATYFGPFTSAKTVRETLKILRRIFPYCSATLIPSKPCFYYGIGLCMGPCGGFVTKREYRNMIRNLRLFLSGKKKLVFYSLEKEMNKMAAQQNYEKAIELRNRMEKLQTLVTSVRLPNEYLNYPDLLKKSHEEELSDLEEVLRPYFPGIQPIKRIEAYDISNLLGSLATGSMIVFTNAEADKSQYRRFKIRYTQLKPDDPRMMKEVLSRRIKHADWELPQLFLIDGGKGQINAALDVLTGDNISVPIIGLAKRNEELVIKTLSEKFKIVRLPRSSAALRLLQRMRDESHRFAITYHKKLRRNSMLEELKKHSGE